MESIILLGILLFLILLGAPIGFILILIPFVYILFTDAVPLILIPSQMFNAIDSVPLTAIAFFMLTAKIKIMGDPVRLRSQFSSSPIAPREVSNQLKGPDAAIIIKTIAELRNARRKAPVQSFHLIVR